jgi:hypothetical protein
MGQRASMEKDFVAITVPNKAEAPLRSDRLNRAMHRCTSFLAWAVSPSVHGNDVADLSPHSLAPLS